MHMNQATRQPPSQGGEQEIRIQGNAETPSPFSNIDFAKVAWDARYLLLLGTLIGLGLGYFHYSRSQEMFRSSALVQIVESTTRNLPVDGIDQGLSTRSFADEAMVIRSEHILQQAAEIGELAKTPEYAGMSPEVIAMMVGGLDLAVEPANTGNSSVFRIQFDSPSAATSRLVVQSIVDAYGQHLKQQYRNVGLETIDLIDKARVEVLKNLTDMEREFNDYKQSSELIYHGNEITSVHRDQADRYMAQRQELMIRLAKLDGTLASARLAIKEKRPNESILIALNSFTNPTGSRGDAANVVSPEKSWELERIKRKPLLSTAERMRQERLLPLELERETLIKNVGRDHPAVETLDTRISIISKTIDAVQESEVALNREIDEAMSSAVKVAEENYRQKREDVQRDTLEEQITFVVAGLLQQRGAVVEELNLLTEAYDEEMKFARNENEGAIRSDQYVREIDRQQKLYDRIVARLEEVNLMSEGDGLKVFSLNSAKPGYQVAPSLAKSLLMGGFLGCILAGGLALLREFSDRSYHSAREIAEHTRLPILGHVPVLRSYKVEKGQPGELMDPRLVTFFNGKGQRAEAFRALRTAIYFSNQSGANQVLQITSGTPSDGKTTIAANTAIAIAQSGRSVLLMDADLRRPRVGKAMGIEKSTGSAWAIERFNRMGPDAVLDIHESINETHVPNLSVMTAGDRPDNPSELLSSKGFDQLLSELRKKFDMIILDSPPMLAVSDPANIAPRVDGVVFVIRLRKNIKPAVAQATRMLETLEANVLGIVVNGVGSRAAGNYGKSSSVEGESNYGTSYQYGYGYSYGYTYGYTNGGRYNAYYEEEPRSRKKNKKKKRASANSATES